ncbi:hypothetical protein E4T49_04949 [Aureobasidium sp. EXF-10728]|nr:hypothetical protein E4T49_04949 [Aureobasidium sp. EXF-10728]
MEQPHNQHMPAAGMDKLLLDELKEILEAHNEDAFYWLLRALDAYYNFHISGGALWIWVCKTLYDTSSSHLLERCKIFLREGEDSEQLDSLSVAVTKLAHDPEPFRSLAYDWGLPIKQHDWEILATQHRLEKIRRQEMHHRHARAVNTHPATEQSASAKPSTATIQPARTDESTLNTGQTEVANQPAHNENTALSQHLAELTNDLQVKSSTASAQPAQTNNLGVTQQLTESTKPRVEQSETPTQITHNGDAELAKQPSQPLLDLTSSAAIDQQVPKPAVEPSTTAMAPITPAATPATSPVTKPATTRKSARTSKFSQPAMHATSHPDVAPHKPDASVKPPTSTKPIAPVKPVPTSKSTTAVKSSAPVAAAPPGIRQRPVWKSPWKKNPMLLTPLAPNFPISDVRNEGKGKQPMGPPPLPEHVASALAHEGAYVAPLYKPVESLDKYIEPLSPVLAPKLDGLPVEEQAELVYKQLLAVGERQKDITGKYRSVADDLKAQAEAEVEAQKKGDDVDMGGQ